MFDQLKAEFEEAIRALCSRIAEECAYIPSGLARLIRQDGGLGAAKGLLHRRLSPGFKKLQSMRRLDLMVEYLILQPRWRHLFTDDEIRIAETRLRNAGGTRESYERRES